MRRITALNWKCVGFGVLVMISLVSVLVTLVGSALLGEGARHFARAAAAGSSDTSGSALWLGLGIGAAAFCAATAISFALVCAWQVNSWREGLLYALGTWAGCVTALAATAALATLLWMPSLLTIGTTAAAGFGSVIAAPPGLRELSEIHPRLVSDIKLIKGKVVSELRLDPPKSRSLVKVAEKAAAPWVGPARRILHRSLAAASQGLGWLAVFLILSGLGSLSGGAWAGRRREKKAPERAETSRAAPLIHLQQMDTLDRGAQ